MKYVSNQHVLQVPTTSAFRMMLMCAALALILGASLVAGGLVITAKKTKNDGEASTSLDTATLSSLSAPAADRSTTLSVACDDPERCGELEGYNAHTQNTKDDPKEEPEEDDIELEHSIDSYLTGLEAAKKADVIRKQGFEIHATKTPQPLLEQPQAVDVSTSNFKYDYVEAFFKSLLMFEVQRGGTQVRMQPPSSSPVAPLHVLYVCTPRAPSLSL